MHYELFFIFLFWWPTSLQTAKTDEFLLTLAKKDKLNDNLVLDKFTDIFNPLYKLLKEFEGKDASF